VESGVDAQIKGSVAAQAAGLASGEELGVKSADYAQGNAEYNAALGDEAEVASLNNPVPYAGAANNAESQAFGQATTINQENQAWEGQLIGAATSLGGAALGSFSGPSGGGLGYNPTITDEENDQMDPYSNENYGNTVGTIAAGSIGEV
jgi:hypothetical protein